MSQFRKSIIVVAGEDKAIDVTLCKADGTLFDLTGWSRVAFGASKSLADEATIAKNGTPSVLGDFTVNVTTSVVSVRLTAADTTLMADGEFICDLNITISGLKIYSEKFLISVQVGVAK